MVILVSMQLRHGTDRRDIETTHCRTDVVGQVMNEETDQVAREFFHSDKGSDV